MKEIKKQRKEENAMQGNFLFFYNVSSKDKGLPETLYRRNPT